MLTALHCINKQKNTKFYNHKGQFSYANKKYKAKVKADLDLCVIKLEQPIGIPHKKISTSKSFNRNHIKSTLITRYNGELATYDITLDATKTLLKHDRLFTVFNTKSIQVGPGFSGSPILDKDNRIISVVARLSSDSKEALEKIENVTGQHVKSPHPFEAPSPYEFAKFMDKVLKL